MSENPVEIYLEIGKKRVFAGALDWPGWCRSGRDEAIAQQALLDYAKRYQAIIQHAGLDFPLPASPSTLLIVERLEGGSTTDFGAPERAPSADAAPLDEAGLQRVEALLEACWAAFDAALEAAHGKELRRGPRGGGRQLEGLLEHVLGAEAGYLASLGGKAPKVDEEDMQAGLAPMRQAILDTLRRSARGEIPERGPRGGVRWTARYFVRREAWHVLDHVWEIEDRVEEPSEK